MLCAHLHPQQRTAGHAHATACPLAVCAPARSAVQRWTCTHLVQQVAQVGGGAVHRAHVVNQPPPHPKVALERTAGRDVGGRNSTTVSSCLQLPGVVSSSGSSGRPAPSMHSRTPTKQGASRALHGCCTLGPTRSHCRRSNRSSTRAAAAVCIAHPMHAPCSFWWRCP